MEHRDDDIHATRAITKLWACGEALKETNGAMGDMLDDVMVASGCSEKQDVLTAWNQGLHKVDEHRRFVAEMVDETIDFMGSGDYSTLDGDKKTDYWEVLRTTEKDLEKIDSQIFFYQLLSQIEHTEQTIGFLGPCLKEVRDLILSCQLDGSLAHSGLILHKRRIMLITQSPPIGNLKHHETHRQSYQPSSLHEYDQGETKRIGSKVESLRKSTLGNRRGLIAHNQRRMYGRRQGSFWRRI